MVNRNRPLVIGVAGGTGSGKTTVSRVIRKRVGMERIAYLQHDSYYKDLSHLSQAERDRVNFDHPDSLDSALLVDHLQQLLAGHTIRIPNYDFASHTRMSTTTKIPSKSVILVEGILIFVEPALRDLFDMKIFVDTEGDVRFIRRLSRDIKQRGRSTESVIKQWLSTVKPMHEKFVEPSKQWADIIIPRGGRNSVATDLVVTKIEQILKK